MLENPNFFPGSEEKDHPKEERGSPDKISRRVFLEKMLKGAAVLGIGGLGPLMSGGRVTSGMELRNEEISEGLENFNRKLEDPNGYLEYLEDREFVIQNEIFDAYAKTVDKRPHWGGDPVGGYLSKNYLDKKVEVEEFAERLAKLKLSKNEIKFYESLFTSTDLIIFRESILQQEFFLKALPHERFHMKMKELDSKEYNYMMKVAKNLLSRTDKDNFHFVTENMDSKYVGGFAKMQAHMNPEEFYTYLAQGEFVPEAEEAFKNEFPDAYEVFSKIKESCKLKEQK
jgi:hypothetical protein